MKGRMRRSTKKTLGIVIIVGAIMAGCIAGGYLYLEQRLDAKYLDEITEKDELIRNQSRSGYVALREIEAGEIISYDNVEYQEFFSSQPQEMFVSEEVIGKAALIPISQNVQLTQMMIADDVIEDNIREMHFGEIGLHQNITSNSVCDVRITYPNGETYVVLPKKSIRNVSEEMTDCYIWLNPEEIDLVSSAIVDAYLYQGTLFCTKYVQPTIQKPSTVSYTPSVQTINLIKTDPNIVDISSKYLSTVNRMNLENRLQETLNKSGEEYEQKWSENQLSEQTKLESADKKASTETSIKDINTDTDKNKTQANTSKAEDEKKTESMEKSEEDYFLD